MIIWKGAEILAYLNVFHHSTGETGENDVDFAQDKSWPLQVYPVDV
jgi:hypothetical protein